MIREEEKKRLLKATSYKEIQEIMLELGVSSSEVGHEVLQHFCELIKDPNFDYNCVTDPPEAFGRKSVKSSNIKTV